LVTVVVILGLIATIAIPRVSDMSRQSRIAAFAASLRNFCSGIELYRHEHGDWPPDGSTGVVPTELRPYVDAREWENGRPLGGAWDNETRDSGGVTAAMGVVEQAGDAPDPALAASIDAMLDDGDLATGVFRSIRADGYYCILEE